MHSHFYSSHFYFYFTLFYTFFPVSFHNTLFTPSNTLLIPVSPPTVPALPPLRATRYLRGLLAHCTPHTFGPSVHSMKSCIRENHPYEHDPRGGLASFLRPSAPTSEQEANVLNLLAGRCRREGLGRRSQSRVGTLSRRYH